MVVVVVVARGRGSSEGMGRKRHHSTIKNIWNVVGRHETGKGTMVHCKVTKGVTFIEIGFVREEGGRGSSGRTVTTLINNDCRTHVPLYSLTSSMFTSPVIGLTIA